MSRGRLTVLVGGGLGSEGKGTISALLADEYNWHVRVGGPNAGHSFKYNGRTIVMQSIPCGWTNFNAKMVIGAGGIIEIDRLFDEIDTIAEYDSAIKQRLFIDSQATILDHEAQMEEGGTRGDIHQDIGSTGEGVGAARRRRMARDPLGRRDPSNKLHLARDHSDLLPFIPDEPVSKILYDALLRGEDVLIEGTQGSGLSLIHGPWPYTTSTDTNAAQMLADVGLPPAWVTDVILVTRTFPIRVAGNSGPLKNEVDWDYISSRVGRNVLEHTTVTKKVRRIGLWDDDLFLQAVRLNAPTQVALTFVDYLSPGDEGKTVYGDLSSESHDFIAHVESLAGAPVTFIGTGGGNWHVIRR